MNRLVIDVGNTNIAYAIFRHGDLIKPRRVPTSSISDVHDLDTNFNALIDEFESEVDEVVICCGVARVKNLLDRCKVLKHRKAVFISGLNTGGAKLKYETPETLGPDRIANTIAAVHYFGSDVLVIDCGTAINIDLIDSDGFFAGGIIAPGIETSRDSLCNYAPSLPKVEISPSVKLIGTNTKECIQSGVINGSIALINHVIDVLGNEIEELKIVMTGGHAEFVYPGIVSDAILDEWFTLKGLGLAVEN